MDLTTTYLGMTLRTPLVASASPLSEEIDTIRRMEDAGIPAVVLHSPFEERSWDSRYFGPIPAACVTDVVAPLVTFR